MEAGSILLLILIVIVTFILSFIGATVGLVLGHLRLPLLILYLGSPSTGAATNLIVSASGALAGSARHARDGRISWVGLAIMGIPSGLGAVLAVLIFVKINPFWAYLIIGVVMIVSGIQLVRKKQINPPPGEVPWIRRVALEILIGVVLGAVAAVTGLMLGSLRLPIMIRYLRMDPKEAIGTNMAVGCFTGLVGACAAFLSGNVKFHWIVIGLVVLPTLIGGYLGGWLTGRLSKESVQKVAGWIIAVSGVLLLFQGAFFAYRKSSRQIAPVVVDEQDHEGWLDFEPFEDDPVLDPDLDPDPSRKDPEEDPM